jgi:hypothetical protein
MTCAYCHCNQDQLFPMLDVFLSEEWEAAHDELVRRGCSNCTAAAFTYVVERRMHPQSGNHAATMDDIEAYLRGVRQ